MKKRNRMLAILLAFTMVLTFMPMLAFAEGEDADAEPQVTETAEEVAADAEEAVVDSAEEAVVEEAAEEAVEPKEALGASVPKSAVFHHKGDLQGWAGDNQIEDNGFYMSYDNEPNSIDVTFSDGNVKTYKFIGDDDQDAWGYYLGGKISNGETDFFYDTSVRLKEGKNSVALYMSVGEDEYKVGTIEITGIKAKVDKLVYTQKAPLEAELNERGFADYYGPEEDWYSSFEGDTVQVKAYNTVESYDENDNVTIEYKPYEAIYECRKDSFEDEGYEYYSFWLKEVISGDESFVNPELGIKFWDDQDENPWKAGSTHEISATYEGFAAEGKIVVNVKGNAAPHAHVAGRVEQITVTEATCTKGGTYDEVTYCKECGEEMSRVRKTSKALGHSLHKIAAKPATCQETGVKTHYECQNCGELFKDAKGKKKTTVKALTVKKKKHNYKEKTIDDEHLKSAATCTKPAVYYYSCKMCHEMGKKTFKTGKALGHDFVAGNITKASAKKDGKIASKCSRCGKTNKGTKIPKASKIVVLNKKSVAYVGAGGEKDLIKPVVKNSKYPLNENEYDVSFSEPVYKGKKSIGTVVIRFKPECRYYSGSMTLTYKITKVPKTIN